MYEPHKALHGGKHDFAVEKTTIFLYNGGGYIWEIRYRKN
jgi:hypothetical protein